VVVGAAGVVVSGSGGAWTAGGTAAASSVGLFGEPEHPAASRAARMRRNTAHWAGAIDS